MLGLGLMLRDSQPIMRMIKVIEDEVGFPDNLEFEFKVLRRRLSCKH